MNGQHLTWEDRVKLEAYLKAGKTRTWIAGALGCSRKTVYNEIKRGEYTHMKTDLTFEIRYSAEKAQQLHDFNGSAKGRPLKIGNDYEFAAFIEQKILRDKFSPAAALAAAQEAGFTLSICLTTLYNYISNGVFYELTDNDLWNKGRKTKRSSPSARRATPHPQWPSITDRPKAASEWTEAGHWEMDLIIGAKGQGSVLLTLVDRKNREEIIKKLPNRKAETVRAAFDKMERAMGKKRFGSKFKTITTDNGSEFLQYDKLKQSVFDGQRFEVYYCHSYAAWEKGSVENHNRMIRRWFPKGTNFDRVTKKQIAFVQDWMNDYPRKILNWRTPNQVSAE
ncbi:MAG: IS30 family transposase [Oscillospiraceae bacterium]|nr:IS30 family transposase [Oscillospiraceae bacterium]